MDDKELKDRAGCFLCHCEVRETENLGRAAFATRDLPCGAPVVVESPFLLIGDAAAGGSAARAKDIERITRKHNLPQTMLDFFEPCLGVGWAETTKEDRAFLLQNFYYPHSSEELRPYVNKTAPKDIEANERSVYVCLAACADLAKLPWLSKHVPEWGAIEWFQFLQAADLNIHKDSSNPASAQFGGLFLVGSKFTHSCAPNCLWQFDAKGSLVYVCLRKIQKGEMLTFSYVGDGIDLLQGTLQKNLKNISGT